MDITPLIAAGMVIVVFAKLLFHGPSPMWKKIFTIEKDDES